MKCFIIIVLTLKTRHAISSDYFLLFEIINCFVCLAKKYTKV